MSIFETVQSILFSPIRFRSPVCFGPGDPTEKIQSEETMSSNSGDALKWLLNFRKDMWGKSVFRTIAGDNKPKFIHYGSPNKVYMMTQEVFNERDHWYVLGDIHGDFFALYSAIQYIRDLHVDDKNKFGIIFLGDLIDRGPHPMECLWYLLRISQLHPEQVLWIAGNHDIAFSHNEEENCFASSVSPAEFLDCLNNSTIESKYKDFGREYIELTRDLPRAALLPDGLLLTHGGFPLTDLQQQLLECKDDNEKIQWLNSTAALQDFTWTRITSYRKKLPNRNSKGCSYGYSDFEAFCEATKDFFPAKRLVTAHEHPAGGFDLHLAWKNNPALTLTGFGFHQNYDCAEAFSSRYRDNLIIARCRKDDIPEVIQIPVDRQNLQEYFEAEIAPRFQDPNSDILVLEPESIVTENKS